MKKIFTLLVGALFAGNTFGQELVINGNLEGANPEGQSCFWVQNTDQDGPTDFGQGQVTHSDGKLGWKEFANIVEDPWKAGNHIIKVHVASKTESGENARTDSDGKYYSWNTQFFILTTEPMPENKYITLKFKVRASVDGTMDDTQAHQGVGEYNASNLLPEKVQYYADKWKSYKFVFKVTSSFVTGNNHSSFGAICFNLSTTAEESFEMYFDDMSVVMTDENPVEDTSDWINFLRKGIYSEDHITGIGKNNGKDEPFECTNFTIQVPREDGNGTDLIKAPLETTDDGKVAVKVPVRGYTIKEEQDTIEGGELKYETDENGELVIDPETGQPIPVMVKRYYWSNGNYIGTSAPQRWACQFFVSTLHKMKGGERYKFKFQVKADKATKMGTQGHYGPSQYKDYNTFGGDNDFAVGTDWTTYDLGEAQGKTIPSGAAGCQTCCFDCITLEGEDNYFYFIFEEFSYTEQNVTISDRTLGEEDAYWVAPGLGEEGSNTIDATPMLAAFEEESLAFMDNTEKNGVKLITWTQPEDPDEEPTLTYCGLREWTTGGTIAADGYFKDDDYQEGISLYFDAASVDGNNVNLGIYNDAASGVAFTDGEVVATDFCVSSSGWYYIYHAKLANAATIEKLKAEAAGIQGVKAVKVDNGLIYNLAGQRVDSSYKGIVIKNGQKAIQK